MKKQNFSGVQDTLFIPLAARAAVSRRFPEYFYDEKAMQFCDPEQVKAINAESSEYSSIASAAGYYNMDRFVRVFLGKYPDGNAGMLGAGLETMNFRIGGPSARFYTVDFPEVTELRRQILGTAENEMPISRGLPGQGPV